MLVRWKGGYMEETDAGGVTEWGRKEGFLQLGNVTEVTEVDRISAAVLGFQGEPRVATTLSIEPSGDGDEPFVDFAVGDTITAPDETEAAATQRVMSLTVVEDENGEVTYANELRNTLALQEERFDNQLKQMSNGTLRGSSDSASPNPGPIYTNAENGDSVGALRTYMNTQLLRRQQIWQDPGNPIFGTFDPAADQQIVLDDTFNMTSGLAGFTNIDISGAFPSGLMNAMVQMGDAPGGFAYYVTVLNGSSDNNQIAVLIVDAAGSAYPDTSPLVVNVHAVGW